LAAAGDALRGNGHADTDLGAGDNHIVIGVQSDHGADHGFGVQIDHAHVFVLGF